MRTRFFSLFMVLLVSKTAIAQEVVGQLVLPANEVKMRTNVQNLQNKFTRTFAGALLQGKGSLPIAQHFQPQFIYLPLAVNSFFLKMPAAIPPDHYNTGIGWMCLQEWKLEKTINIPLKMRLGNTEQVDYLEGKRFQLWRAGY